MEESFIVIVALIILVFIVIIGITITVLMREKTGKRIRYEKLKFCGNFENFSEIDKSMIAIEYGYVKNEKQINHAKKHNDSKEVKTFKKFTQNNVLNMKEIGNVVYGEY